MLVIWLVFKWQPERGKLIVCSFAGIILRFDRDIWFPFFFFFFLSGLGSVCKLGPYACETFSFYFKTNSMSSLASRLVHEEGGAFKKKPFCFYLEPSVVYPE